MNRALTLPYRLAYLLLLGISISVADYRDIPTKPTLGDKMLAEYFELETRKIEEATFSTIKTKADWLGARDNYRQQLFEMLGMSPLPERTPLNAKTTGSETLDDLIVEKVVFESSPGLYVTGNFYRPRTQEGPLPTILYVCGHGPAKKDGVSYGNKVSYQHHGAWFARNGYTCLILDTLQMGEIEGIHHGTYRYERWWWHSRGYTSAGVEAWNCMRALDYLETRKEVDKDNFGVTGRSGGGAYSWWIAALDERIKVAVPVAGITSLRNHIVDGCVEGHCDCMFQVNTYRWDYPMIAALVAPRSLLIANTDKDHIFPLDGVVDVYTKTRHIYKLLGAEDKIGFAITEGPHKDTQPMRTMAFHWFERFLKRRDLAHEIPDTTAPKPFTMEHLKVLKDIPKNEKNTTIDETFTKRVPQEIEPPQSVDEWNKQRDTWMGQLRDQVFSGWPDQAPELDVKRVESAVRHGTRFSRYEFTSQAPWRLSFVLIHPTDMKPINIPRVHVQILDDNSWDNYAAGLSTVFPKTYSGSDHPDSDSLMVKDLSDMVQGAVHGAAAPLVLFVPRGIGLTRWTTDKKERTQILRRFPLVGQSLDGMHVWDIRRAIQAIRTLTRGEVKPTWIILDSWQKMASNALYASLFEPGNFNLDLHDLPHGHQEPAAATYLNVMRFLDMPQALAMAAERSKVTLYTTQPEVWQYTREVGNLLERADRLIFRPPLTK